MTDDIERQLTRLWEEMLGVRPIGIQDSFFNLGGDSILALRMISEVERIFDQNPSILSFLQAPTIEQLTRLIVDSDQMSSWPSLVPIQPAGDKPPFFCVHGGGGKIIRHYGLGNHLPSDQPFYGLQSPPMNDDQLAQLRVEDLAVHYVLELRAFQPEGPYYLGGLCFGGPVAYEMAQQLAALGERTNLLVLFDTQYWGDAMRFKYANFQLQQFVRRTMRRGRRRLGLGTKLTRKPLSRDPKDHPDLKNKVRAALIKAVMNYEPGVYPGRITCFLGNEHYHHNHKNDRRLGWNHLAAGGLETHVVPGFEARMFDDPNAEVVAKEFLACLAEAQAA